MDGLIRHFVNHTVSIKRPPELKAPWIIPQSRIVRVDPIVLIGDLVFEPVWVKNTRKTKTLSRLYRNHLTGYSVFPEEVTDTGVFINVGPCHAIPVCNSRLWRHVNHVNIRSYNSALNFGFAGDFVQVESDLFLAPVADVTSGGRFKKGAAHVTQKGKMQYAHRFTTTTPYVWNAEKNRWESTATLAGEKFLIDTKGERILEGL